jgi:hypothetical protein
MAKRITTVVVDCTDPVRLAGFWCEVLGYQVLADPEGNQFCLLAGRVAPL